MTTTSVIRDGIHTKRAAKDAGNHNEADWPAWVWVALRTDHAGETGAVWIYKGILLTSRDADVLAFARTHMKTESRHLHEISAILPQARRSKLVWLWRVLGWLTGAIPGLIGRNMVFATIEAVETFVDRHYQDQIDRLTAKGGDPVLASMLDGWRQDEVAHRDDAACRMNVPAGFAVAAWTKAVSAGSALAVAVARHV